MAEKNTKKKEPKTIWEKSNARALESFASDYKAFLDKGKTERECVAWMTAALKKAGARDLADLVGTRKKLKAGDLVYTDMMKKALLIVRLGKKPLTEGMRSPPPSAPERMRSQIISTICR